MCKDCDGVWLVKSVMMVVSCVVYYSDVDD